jgi:alkanesulfonate monooxygenase SsuD/methylene tetrahydromethanopterin reductase-like flavin-dependent oxidoreductase (luciferase family)
MQFGYFTLSDNHYDNSIRSANDFVADIIDEAVYDLEVGLHSAWIDEHHFSTLGVLSCPDLVLANVAARTRHIRLAPPSPFCHCITRSALPNNGPPST